MDAMATQLQARLQTLGRDPRALYVLGYVTLWSAQSLLIKASLVSLPPDGDEARRAYPYEVLAVTMATEVFKLMVALAMYIREPSGSSLNRKVAALRHSFRIGRFLLIPAGVYLIYNRLAFVNLQLLDPGTYRVLINSRIIFSGLLMQQFFDMRLAPKQWVALVLLLCACMIEQSDSFSLENGFLAIMLMGMQGLCSSLGGVSFQWLLQRHGASDVGIWVKNIYLYGWSILCNIAAIAVLRPDLFSPTAFFRNFDLSVVPIIVIAGLGGVFTSLLLRHLDVLAKEYANFAEMVVVTIAQRLLFGTPIRPTLLLAIFLVSYSLYMYNTNGVKAEAQKLHTDDDHGFDWGADDFDEELELIGSAPRPVGL